MMAIYADTNGSANNDGLYLRVIRVFLHPELSCKGSQITFKFEDTKDGDYVMTGSGNATYTMQEDRTTSGCSTYAKMGSKIKGIRQINVDVTSSNQNGGFMNQKGIPLNVDFDGEYHADNSYNGYSYRTDITDPYVNLNQYITPTSYPVPVGNLTVNVLSQEIAPMYNRKVVIKWNVIESSQTGSSVFYDIYGKPDGDTEWHRIRSDQAGPSAELTIGRDDYSIKAQACIRKVGNCIDSNTLVLPKISEENGAVITTKPIESISSAPSENNSQVEELNKKVASLEGKLAESEKKQSALEQTLNNLLSWIKSRFWFFR